MFDVRAEKTVNFTSRDPRPRLFLDLFNITNSHASETISRATGLGYQKPSAILAPRYGTCWFPVPLVAIVRSRSDLDRRPQSWLLWGSHVAGGSQPQALPRFFNMVEVDCSGCQHATGAVQGGQVEITFDSRRWSGP